MRRERNRGSWISCCRNSTNRFFSRAGVGSALEGGRGRAGTKLFQDFQMLSRIWTHPWCLQLDYISKENKVNEQWHTSGKLQGLSSFISTQTNPGGGGRTRPEFPRSRHISAHSQSRRARRPASCPVHVTRRRVLYLLSRTFLNIHNANAQLYGTR